VRRADDALYEAKGSGRDRCVIAHTDGPTTMTDVGETSSAKRVREPAFAVPSGVLARLAHDDDPMEI
jgi:hypothetical protein